jgi:hypothetical protein
MFIFLHKKPEMARAGGKKKGAAAAAAAKAAADVAGPVAAPAKDDTDLRKMSDKIDKLGLEIKDILKHLVTIGENLNKLTRSRGFTAPAPVGASGGNDFPMLNVMYTYGATRGTPGHIRGLFNPKKTLTWGEKMSNSIGSL